MTILKWALIFLVVSIIAGILGFTRRDVPARKRQQARLIEGVTQLRMLGKFVQ